MSQDYRKPPRQGNWRKDYADYGVLATSHTQRKALWERDKGRCYDCGAIVSHYQADHDVPLFSLTESQLADYPSVLRFWSLSNLKTRGESCGCHQKKTNTERTQQAKVIRIQKKQLGRPRKYFFPSPKSIQNAKPKRKGPRPPVVCHLNLKSKGK